MLNKNRINLLWIIIFAAVFALRVPIAAAEHAGSKVIGAEERMVQTAARDYINAQTGKLGSFQIDDAKLGKKWNLKFDFFHTVNQLDNGDYFFCADFTQDQDRLDLDFTLSGEDLSVNKVVIHKVNGVAR
jgi:hypothetical protein